MKPKFVIGGVIVALTIIYLVWVAAKGTAAYYLTIEELWQQGPSARNVRVAGVIVPGSIVWQEREFLLAFQIADEGGVLPVVYRGTRPDMFRDGAEIVIEGQYSYTQGVFEAQSLLLKCPSKYQEAASDG